MADTHTNQYGRKPGRGLRPWLLMPKVLGVATYFGSLIAAGAVSIAAHPQTESQWHELGRTLGVIFRFAAVPGLLVAILFGVLLMFQHPIVFIRMRWVQVKLAILLVALPMLHLFMSSLVSFMSHADYQDDSFAPQRALNLFHIGLLAALLIAVVLIWLGRHKPRLGQNIAVMYRKLAASKGPTP